MLEILYPNAVSLLCMKVTQQKTKSTSSILLDCSFIRIALSKEKKIKSNISEVEIEH